jgi:5-methylthioadenosine/S-adenosylhomocysteine deaminase
MYGHPQATARAVIDSGLEATIGGPLFDAGVAQAKTKERVLADLDALEALGPGVGRALAPHSIYTVSADLLRWTADAAAERGVPVHIHISETEHEVSDCLRDHGMRPAAYLDELGLLRESTLLAHGVWLDRGELELIAERGCTVVTNPVANMKLTVGGIFPYPQAREAGVAVGLGTDGAGSNDSLDLLADLKTFALVQRHAAGDPTVVPAAEAWEIATGGGGALLRGDEAAPEIGARANFLLLRRDSHELGLGELLANLVYAASGSVVDTTVVAGRPLMRGGVVEEAAEVVARAAERAARLGIKP